MQNKTILLILAALIAAVALTALSCAFFAFQTNELYMSLSVGEHVGFDVNTTAVTFGTVLPGGVVQRDLTITNTDGYDKVASFSVEGNISRFVRPPADALAKAAANTSVGIKAEVPQDTTFGEYTGKLRVTLRRAI